MILRAMKHTKSNMAAARFLGCSYPHYKQYAKLYKNEEGKTLFEAHLNRQGKGISKHLYKKKDLTPICSASLWIFLSFGCLTFKGE